ncbi:MAG TPA: FAD-dependent oxidoreductase, partial [Thermoanaerobaculia bacterium]|nr:FAD-dependent oxidoreductase [Thermoanaerobaculia bacterium]
MSTCDYLIIGGGVVGLSVARELKLRRPDARIMLIEKEDSLGAHASGRNSGVIHCGIYYTADSLKARLTKEGNAALVAFCAEKKIPVRRCGKLIVARSEAEHPMLDELLRRGAANGVEVQDLSEEEARKIEPRARTAGRALFVRSTASVDPRLVVAALAEECRDLGIAIATRTAYRGLVPSSRNSNPRSRNLTPFAPSPGGEGGTLKVRTSGGDFSAGFLVNCAGLYADKVARDFGFSQRYRILPFKGLYLESPEPAESLRCHVYPAPSKTNPFLGVHATVKPDGHWKIGPTAIPALWRENYRGLERFDAGELGEIAFRQLSLLFGSGFDFRRLAWEEVRKQSRRRLLALAGHLMEGVSTDQPWKWGTPGIRAQLVDVESKRLVDDFVLEGD